MLTLAIPLKPVTSSNIKAVGYDEERHILAIEFASGTYYYADFPKEAYDAFVAADSLGKHFAAFIRAKYAGVKVLIADSAAPAAEKGEQDNGSELSGTLSA